MAYNYKEPRLDELERIRKDAERAQEMIAPFQERAEEAKEAVALARQQTKAIAEGLDLSHLTSGAVNLALAPYVSTILRSKVSCGGVFEPPFPISSAYSFLSSFKGLGSTSSLLNFIGGHNALADALAPTRRLAGIDSIVGALVSSADAGSLLRSAMNVEGALGIRSAMNMEGALGVLKSMPELGSVASMMADLNRSPLFANISSLGFMSIGVEASMGRSYLHRRESDTHEISSRFDYSFEEHDSKGNHTHLHFSQGMNVTVNLVSNAPITSLQIGDGNNTNVGTQFSQEGSLAFQLLTLIHESRSTLHRIPSRYISQFEDTIEHLTDRVLQSNIHSDNIKDEVYSLAMLIYVNPENKDLCYRLLSLHSQL